MAREGVEQRMVVYRHAIGATFVRNVDMGTCQDRAILPSIVVAVAIQCGSTCKVGHTVHSAVGGAMECVRSSLKDEGISVFCALLLSGTGSLEDGT